MSFILRRKIWKVERALDLLLVNEGCPPVIWSYCKSTKKPFGFLFVVGVRTDMDKDKLKSDQNFSHVMVSLLQKYRWPEKLRNNVTFCIESQETVEREYEGDWSKQYKATLY